MAQTTPPAALPTAATPPHNQVELDERYRTLRARHEQARGALERTRGRLLQALALVFVAAIVLSGRAAHAVGLGWTLLASFAAIAVLIVFSLRLQARVSRVERLVELYKHNLARVGPAADDDKPVVLDKDATDSFVPAGHLYAGDLDLVGRDSLLNRLDTVRTGPGRRGLANYLLEPADFAESTARQQAVRELLPETGLRERIALLGATRFQQISARYFDDWLDEEAPLFHPAFRYALLLTAVVAVALLLVGFTHLRTWSDVTPNLFADLAVQGGICLYLRPRVKPLLDGGARLQGSVRLFAEGLALLQSGSYGSPKLQQLQAQALAPAGAVEALSKLESQLAIVEQRPKEYFLLFSLLLAAGTQAAMSIAQWKRRHAPAMRAWVAAWSEFEALNALATYAYEHPEDAWPELLPHARIPSFAARALGHPLLDAAVTNDLTLDEQTRFFLISGSNMAGKSTLLRAIGINAVLAYAGAPVRAASLQLTTFQLGASLALTDSLAEGKSKFLAEVERLSGVVTLSRTSPVLFLVDEIFSGTNSLDRRTAAGAVLNSLLANGAVGALSTHDLALTDLATSANGGVNRHMASPDADDPLAFDYKLKPGVNTSSNALAILRMMGLET